jgi:pentatricopeptide repeat protein
MNEYWVVGIVVVLVVGWIIRRGERVSTGSRTARPNNLHATPGNIDVLLREGRKLDAIKLYREMHRVDLKAAKDAIDTRSRELLGR